MKIGLLTAVALMVGSYGIVAQEKPKPGADNNGEQFRRQYR